MAAYKVHGLRAAHLFICFVQDKYSFPFSHLSIFDKNAGILHGSECIEQTEVQSPLLSIQHLQMALGRLQELDLAIGLLQVLPDL